MTNELVSVIMPAYRSQDYIFHSVLSVLNQTYKNWELIIISDDEFDYEKHFHDNGYTDKRIRFDATGKTGAGPSKARNTGIDAAKGRIIALLDSDDEFRTDKLELMVPKALEYGLATSSFDRVKRVNGLKHKIDTSLCLSKNGEIDIIGFLSTNYNTNAILVYDRDKIPARYPEYISYLEDITFSVSCFDYIDTAYYLNEPLHYWVRRENSLSNNKSAPAHFIAAKTLLLEKIAANSFEIRNTKSLSAYHDFLEISLECEKIFDKRLSDSSEVIDFTDIFTAQISKLYPDEIYEYKGKKYQNGQIIG